MKLRHPEFEIVDCNKILHNVELGARICYKSEDAICPGSDERIINKVLTAKNGIKHESVLEHGVITARFVTDRGVSHEKVRHRIMAVSQESTRYCNYAKGKYGKQVTVISPFFFNPEAPRKLIHLPRLTVGDSCSLGSGTTAQYANEFDIWVMSCLVTEWAYLTLTDPDIFGRSAQEARSVLPNSLKTEYLVTCNVREWRHILNLRTGRDAHPQMRQIMVPFAHELARRWPCLFGEFAGVTHESPAVQFVPLSSEGRLDELLSGSSTEESNC